MDVRTLCLGILALGPASGYEIKKRLEGPFRHFYDASFGSIYPALSRLLHERLVSCAHEAQSNRPDKKVYTLTPAGRFELVRELSAEPTPDRLRSEFLVVMMFADLLPTRHVASLVDARLTWYRETLDKLHDLQACELNPQQRFVVGYGIAAYTAELQYIEENRHLVEGTALLAQLAGGTERPAPLAEPLPANPAQG
ncbi:MAG: PadR family transcriptional regulator [Alphaproteobacteria bacterium]|nr:PadR family transcriptional regulator [Alphaproteobacteria bacterium]